MTVKKNTPQSNDKKPSHFIYYIIIGGVLLVLLYLFSCTPVKNYPAQKFYSKVKGFSKIKVQSALHNAVELFSKEYGEDFEISQISNLGYIKDIDSAAELMFKNLNIITENDTTGKLEILTSQDFFYRIDRVRPFDKYSLKENLASNIKQGDILTYVKIFDKKQNRYFESINSIDTFGNRVSGVLFQTTVYLAKSEAYSVEPRSKCVTKTLAKYIFTDRPKIQLYACAHADCKSDSTIYYCRCSELKPILDGFGASMKQTENSMIPQNSKPGRCIITITYHWATGFKKVEFENEKLGKFKIEGIIGREGEGHFEVEDICGRYKND